MEASMRGGVGPRATGSRVLILWGRGQRSLRQEPLRPRVFRRLSTKGKFGHVS